MVNMGEGGVGAVLVTMGAWVSDWMMGKRRGKMMCVNAAMREDERGEEGVVVEF
jgi:hypothetical protein